ncbi:division/cell wall cluster transcriptional repressor MraZ [Patescibacteria group bacterium]|nr:division/cell wall cluster transcriptional repressor MraZ [Patescibacteria group bacterium]
MLIGEYNHSIDTKGRMALPIKFRQVFKSGAVITRGLDNCLFIYPKNDWKKLADKLAALPIGQAKTRAFARLMLAGAMDVSLDKQGRVNLPDYLTTYAKLKKKVIITGLYDRLEIWDENEWTKYSKQTETNSSDIAEALGELGV